MGTSRFAKKQLFLAGVVCSLIVVRLVPTVLYFIEALNSPWIDNYELALIALGTLLYVLVLLKLLLPIGASHRKWLGWLLAASLFVGLLMIAKESTSPLSSSFSFEPWLWAGLAPVFASDSLYLNNALLLNPLFYLLLGVVFDWGKMQKIAGGLAVPFLGLALLMQLGWWLIDPPGYLLLQPILTNLCYIILFFKWPVFARPILEKEKIHENHI